MSLIGQTLVARALNATRHVYFPSYLGIRLIGMQLLEPDDGYVERMILRRLNASEKWRYKKFSLYKGSTITRGVAEHEYRDCIAPSPITALAEATVLALMGSEPAFSVSDRVYSYRWPPSAFSGSTYEYFGEGYRRRNLAIDASLSADMVAVVTDVRKFYPSVSFDNIRGVLTARLQRSGDTLRTNQDEILAFFHDLVEEGGGSIPVGPSSGHVLGQLAMEGIDAELADVFGDKYFRYVDDVIAVVPRAEARRARDIIEASLGRRGLEPNQAKSATVSAEEWHRNMVRPDVESADSFYKFARDLTVYLVLHSERAHSLKVAFASSGLAIPVQRFLALSQYSRFRYFLRKSKGVSQVADVVRIWSSSNDVLLLRAQELKRRYETELRRAIEAPRSSDATLRRWQAQRTRRIVNALFYLRGFAEWSEDLGGLDGTPELLQQAALARALSSGAANPILPFYLRGAAAFAELWGEYGRGLVAFEWPQRGLTVAELDSLVLLQLSGVLRVPVNPVQAESPRSRMIAVAARERPARRSIPDLSFEDEIESLRLGMENSMIADLSRTRYSLSEGTMLEALSLLGGGYQS